jgi:hypothetical protein
MNQELILLAMTTVAATTAALRIRTRKTHSLSPDPPASP